MVNKCIKMIKEEKVEIKFPKLEEKLQLIGFCDASRHWLVLQAHKQRLEANLKVVADLELKSIN